ncbi:16S rRNA (cytosine(1402)-N(4))-methyltransferase RsmH [candidate division KSB1 bacterium]|nr:MAG: 16S rRNA (cytosine(1402)-N(4))-methyltransferase RsmH [candidate division KSB1 bacterium]
MKTLNETAFHLPVLLRQVAEFLLTDVDGTYIDFTVGGGGHSKLICEKLGKSGRLIGCDRDAEALVQARSVLSDRVRLVQSRFSDIRGALKEIAAGTVTGILMDLGVSSHHLDDPSRGFSHRTAGALDLRMDQSTGEKAAELLARLSLPDLTDLITMYGEDPQARRIARAIVKEREQSPLATTEALAKVITKSVPATANKSLARVFQALRIAVNDELGELEKGLEAGWDLLKPQGRLAVISYHSLEDRIVKNFMREKAAPTSAAFEPFPTEHIATGRIISRKPITPDEEEIERNPRARSAKLRVIEKLG